MKLHKDPQSSNENFPHLFIFIFSQKEYQRVVRSFILNFVNGVELVSLQLSCDFWKIKCKS